MLRPAPFSRAPQMPVSAGLVLIAAGVFVAKMLGMGLDPLYLQPSAFWTEPWRLVTSSFPHANVVHLAFNLIWTWTFGAVLEERYGHFVLLFATVIIAAGSAAAEYAFFAGGIGLSGIGYGYFGWLWMASRRDHLLRGCMDHRTTVLFVGWFFFCIFATVAKIMPIGNVAHGVGALLGALAGLVFGQAPLRSDIAAGITRRRSAGSAVVRPAAAVAALAVVAAALFGASFGRASINLSPRAHERDGMAAFDAGDFVAAIRHYDRALALDRDEPRLWFNKGVAHERLEQYEACLAAFERAYDLAPDNDRYRQAVVVGHSRLGDQALDAGDNQAAVAEYQRATELDPGSPPHWHNLGVAQQRAGQLEAAAKAQERAHELSRDDPSYREALARAYSRLGNRALDEDTPENAIAHYDRAIEVFPAYPLAWFNKGVALERLERWDEAKKAFRRAAELAPDNPSYQAAAKERTARDQP